MANLLKQGRKIRSPVLTWGLVAAVALAGFAVFGDKGLLKLRTMHAMEDRLEGQISSLAQENGRLAHEIDALEDPKHLEHIVREELGYLRPDEVIFYINDEPTPTR